MLAGCSDPLSGPIDLFHDLEGGEIAAQRPPPPGAGLPYPKLVTVPPKPVLDNPVYRNGLQAQLLAERDRTERLAADTPVPTLPPSPPRAARPADPGQTGDQPAPPGQPASTATLATADAPPAPPPAVRPAASADASAGPAPGTPVTIIGDPANLADAPDLPAAPPPPATFEGVVAEPSPTPRVLPASLAEPPAGTHVYFTEGVDALPPSQTQALREFLSHRGKHGVEVIGLGNVQSDTPDGQATSIGAALRHAQAVSVALQALHVPPDAVRLGANAFGRGAVLRLLP